MTRAPRIARMLDWIARHRGALTALLALAVLGGSLAGYYFLFPARAGEPQPIPFSHRVHAGDKQISCVMCHSHAIDTPNAGVPPLETCMLCHDTIITQHPQIERLRSTFQGQQPLAWRRVNESPDHVFFDHSAHVRAGFDCGRCHGDVKSMDRIRQPQAFEMGWCVQCHRDNKASTDCLTCHR